MSYQVRTVVHLAQCLVLNSGNNRCYLGRAHTSELHSSCLTPASTGMELGMLEGTSLTAPSSIC